MHLFEDLNFLFFLCRYFCVNLIIYDKELNKVVLNKYLIVYTICGNIILYYALYYLLCVMNASLFVYTGGSKTQFYYDIIAGLYVLLPFIMTTMDALLQYQKRFVFFQKLIDIKDIQYNKFYLIIKKIPSIKKMCRYEISIIFLLCLFIEILVLIIAILSVYIALIKSIVTLQLFIASLLAILINNILRFLLIKFKILNIIYTSSTISITIENFSNTFQIYFKLISIINKTSKLFSFHIMLNFVTTFLTITKMLFDNYEYNGWMQSSNLINIIWYTPLLMLHITPLNLCHLITEEVNNFN